MKDRNFVKEIEKLKTAVLGYDREEVVLYIKELVDYYEKKNADAVKELYLEKMRLTTENSGLKSQVSTQEEIYAELAARMDRINQSVEKREESARAIVNNANIEKERILSDAGLERRKILQEADEKQKEILAEAGRQMDVILVKTREKGYSASQNGTADSQNAAGTSQTTQGGVSIETAKQTVMDKIPGIDAGNIYIHTDYDDGISLYEGEAYYAEVKYEFEINAENGNIISWEAESIYD